MFKLTMIKPGAYVDPETGVKVSKGKPVEVNKLTQKMKKVIAAGGIQVEEFKGEKAKKASPSKKEAVPPPAPEDDKEPKDEDDDEEPANPPKMPGTVSTADVAPRKPGIVLPPKRKLTSE